MYNILDTKKTTELYLVRHGWFSREYELTDNVNIYGKITYHWLSRRRATAVSATGMWVFQREETFSRTIFITDENDIKIGEVTRDWFSLRSTLTLQTGFRADFYTRSIFSCENIWESDGYGRIMHIKSSLFSLKDTVYVDQSKAPVALIPLLMFLGEHLIILRRRRKSQH